jgi:transposase-like protein
MHAWWLSECPSGKVIYTTNAIESVSMSLRMISKSWGCFPSDEACYVRQFLRGIVPHSVSEKVLKRGQGRTAFLQFGEAYP